ncbi:hypothetical protein EGK75_08175, partial [Neisseria weixii]
MLISMAASGIVFADENQALQIQQNRLQQEQQRREQFEQIMQPSDDVRLDSSSASIQTFSLPQNESPCFTVHDISLVGDSANKFQFALNKAIKQSGFKPGV